MTVWWVVGGVLVLLLLGLWERGRIRLRRSVNRGKTCPQCGAHEWVRIHRQLSDRLLGIGLGLRRYRCLNCQWQGLRKRRA